MPTGISYPLDFNSRGDLTTSSDEFLVRDHILHILETFPGERIMNQRFGLPNQIFNALVPSVVNNAIKNAILNSIPEEISSLSVATLEASEEGRYRVQIRYSVNNLEQAPIDFTIGQ